MYWWCTEGTKIKEFIFLKNHFYEGTRNPATILTVAGKVHLDKEIGKFLPIRTKERVVELVRALYYGNTSTL